MKHLLRRFMLARKADLPVAQSAESEAPSRAAGSIVELLGPSGIGKTALGREIRHQWGDGWDYDYPKAGQQPVDTQFDALYEQLFAQKMQRLTSLPLPLVTRLGQAAFYARNLEADLRLMGSGHWRRRGLLLHDGLIHNFGLDFGRLFDSQVMSDAVLRAFFAPRVFIGLKAHPETILARLRQRSSETPGALNDWAGQLSEASPTEWVQGYLDRQAKLCVRVVALGASYLELDVEAPAGALGERLQSLEREIIASAPERLRRSEQALAGSGLPV